MACLILQKQIEHINGKKENIVIPSIKMKKFREQNGIFFEDTLLFIFCRFIGECTMEQSPTTANTTQSSPSTADESASASPNNPCVLCFTEEKRLACIPCGHLATCVPCGHSLRSCPICRREIEAFVRIYI
jgi:hypothetical protein